MCSLYKIVDLHNCRVAGVQLTFSGGHFIRERDGVRVTDGGGGGGVRRWGKGGG